MVYICEVSRENNEIDIVFGYTENHYVYYPNDPYAIKIRVGIRYVYYSYFSGDNETIKNKKLDPEDQFSNWFVKPKHIYKTFDEAAKSILRQIF